MGYKKIDEYREKIEMNTEKIVVKKTTAIGYAWVHDFQIKDADESKQIERTQKINKNDKDRLDRKLAYLG